MPDEEKPDSLDACPKCGAEVVSHGSFGFGARREGEPLPEANQQRAECPSCGTKLRRAVGSPWSIDTDQ